MPEVRIIKSVSVSPDGFTAIEFVEGAVHTVSESMAAVLASLQAAEPKLPPKLPTPPKGKGGP